MVASLGLLGAVPARANNDFANGFEDQMGRLLALEAFQIGRLVLSSGLHTHVAYYATAWPRIRAPATTTGTPSTPATRSYRIGAPAAVRRGAIMGITRGTIDTPITIAITASATSVPTGAGTGTTSAGGAHETTGTAWIPRGATALEPRGHLINPSVARHLPSTRSPRCEFSP